MAGMRQGKTALVTGGRRVIDRAATVLFAKEGASVAASDLSVENAEETDAQIKCTCWSGDFRSGWCHSSW